MGVTAVLVFAVELQKLPTKYIFSNFLKDWGEFQMACIERGKKVLKNLFLQNLHRNRKFRTQCIKERI